MVAVLPNQKIHLIQPRRVEYEALLEQEKQDSLTWGLKQLEIPKLWETTKGQEINVAVLDTGVYGAHSVLNDRVKEFIIIDPLGRRIKAEPAFDCGQHGTHVCGTIAGGQDFNGVAIGVAPQTNLFVAGVLIGDTSLRTLMEGISWAIEKGADIINMSLGLNYYEPRFAVVLDILLNQYGILPVVAIGNENHGNSSSPGNTYNAFSVGAIEKTGCDDVDVTFFSSGASLVFPGKEPNGLVIKPDVVAPGAQIYSCIPPIKHPKGTFEYNFMDGTSMATPHVAGVASLLMAAKPTAPVTDIIKVLKETAHHPDGKDLRPCNRWGHGLIQPDEALKALT
ncbi:MAG: S8 family serine peptidase [Chroococcidiopsidaceae cyanobacterium CP_BM_ER_R8_30]|nr:S8 family serine peptidase [Chroococcidiopsidaceae cyanobacterium CP_BM_ER_R8_30]